MENKNTILSDVERNKELFEYEMTQVILQLKGEFAKVSGKDMGIPADDLSAPQINVPTSIPNVTVAPVSLNNDIDEVPACNNHQIPTVNVNYNEVSCPTVPVPSIASLDSVILEESELDCPTVPAINSIVIPDVKLTERDAISVSSSIEFPSGLAEAHIEKINVEVPSTGIRLSEIPDVAIHTVVQSQPEVVKVQRYKPTEVSIEEHLHVNVPDIPMCAFDIDSMKKFRVEPRESVSIPRLKQYTPIEVDTLSEGGVEVTTTHIKEYTPCEVQIEKSTVDVAIPAISPAKPIAVQLEELIPTMDTVVLPDIQSGIAHETIVELHLPNVDVGIPKMKQAEIPPVLIPKSDAITIPNAPNVSADIQAIIESVVSVGS